MAYTLPTLDEKVDSNVRRAFHELTNLVNTIDGRLARSLDGTAGVQRELAALTARLTRLNSLVDSINRRVTALEP